MLPPSGHSQNDCFQEDTELPVEFNRYKSSVSLTATVSLASSKLIKQVYIHRYQHCPLGSTRKTKGSLTPIVLRKTKCSLTHEELERTHATPDGYHRQLSSPLFGEEGVESCEHEEGDREHPPAGACPCDDAVTQRDAH